jgi:hypothetical protein
MSMINLLRGKRLGHGPSLASDGTTLRMQGNRGCPYTERVNRDAYNLRNEVHYDLNWGRPTMLPHRTEQSLAEGSLYRVQDDPSRPSIPLAHQLPSSHAPWEHDMIDRWGIEPVSVSAFSVAGKQ